VTRQLDVNVGTHVAMAVDPDGGIHIAYYDNVNSVMKYVYLSKYDSTFTPVVVDGLLGPGQYNGITVRQYGTNDYRPVISTYSPSYQGTNYPVRVAWPKNSQTAIESGAVKVGFQYLYTGNWEVMAVPASNTPKVAKTFIQTNGATTATGSIVVGFNGDYLEEVTMVE
jgi:hypothetical protein